MRLVVSQFFFWLQAPFRRIVKESLLRFHHEKLEKIDVTGQSHAGHKITAPPKT